MSTGKNSQHKLNGNLINLSGKHSSQLQQPQQNHHHSSKNPNVQQDHHLQQQAQPQQQAASSQQISSSASSSSTASSQHQTVATVHHSFSSNHHRQQQQTPPISQIQNGISSHHHPQHHQHNSQQQNHLTLVNGSTSTSSTGHSIPPRYQPPPQPPGGILKNIPSSSTISGKSGYYPSEYNFPHLNIKCPPEIPKLTSVYIPDTIKNGFGSSGGVGVSSSRFSQRHRLSGGANSGNHNHLSGQNHDEFLLRQQQQQQQEMLKFVRKTENDSTGINGQGGNINQTAGRITAEQNRHLQSLINELRVLKEANQRLNDDNQELRDLCCFLDDDRQKGRKLAREWQRFGRYTASVMRQEVSAYQGKLRQLDDKQQELIRDNLELKELCLYLDEERAHVAANTLCANCGTAPRPALRDDGDGSSSSTNADETMSAIRNYERQLPDLNARSALSDQTLQYVRSLERKIRQLEGEKTLTGNNNNNSKNNSNNNNNSNNVKPQQQQQNDTMTRPEAVVRALQVLEVREQLERDRINNNTQPTGVKGINVDHMDDGEKALVREMCNVVWRKLEESPNGPNIEPL